MKILAITLASLFLIPHQVNAQDPQFDLSQLPQNFTFESTNNDGVIVIRFLQREHGAYIFENRKTDPDGNELVTVIRVNNASQTLSHQNAKSTMVFAPHDCAPSIGYCAFNAMQDGNLFQLESETVRFEDVWIREIFFLVDGTRVPFKRKCTVFDEFGFWVDSVSLQDGEETNWSYRSSPQIDQDPEKRLNRLRKICGLGGAFTS